MRKEFLISIRQWFTYYPVYLAGYGYLTFFINRNIGFLYWALFFITDVKYRMECYRRRVRAAGDDIMKTAMTTDDFIKKYKWGAMR